MREFSIVIIDDEDSHLLITKRALRSFKNFKLLLAHDLLETLESVGQTSVSLFIVDMNLNGESGLSVTKALRSMSPFKITPIILFSTALLEHEIYGAYAAGANIYLHKETRFDEFESTICRAASFLIK